LKTWRILTRFKTTARITTEFVFVMKYIYETCKNTDSEQDG